MRKNKMMRTASGLLVATLLTTSIISGTFAKYTTEASGNDTARVAKWGVTVSTSGNLFGTNYNSNSAVENADSIVASSTNVSSSNDGNIIAPGTKNDSGFTVAISGTPEVAYNIEATNNNVATEEVFLAEGTYGVMIPATGLNAKTDVKKYYVKNSTDDKKFEKATGTWNSASTYFELVDFTVVGTKYYPITWTVQKEGNATAISEKRLDNIATAMLTGIKSTTHNAKDQADASYTLKWEWAFNGNEQNDGADTILGDLQSNELDTNTNKVVVKLNDDNNTYTSNLQDGVDYNLDVQFGMKVTVSQVD